MASRKPNSKKSNIKKPASAEIIEVKTKRKYEGASKSKRLSRWHAPESSANTATASGLPTLRNRSRDLRRNNPYAARAIAALGSNVVGSGILVQFRSDRTVIGKPSRQEIIWREWADSKECDFDGMHNLAGLQRLIMEAVAESGEVLVRKRYDSDRKFPLQYQVLESDFIDTNLSNDKLSNGNFVVQGVEFNKKGQKVALWLLESHPGSADYSYYKTKTKSNRVPMSEVMHIFRRDRPGQARGIPWLAPCIVRLKDFDDFEDAQLMRQKIAACFTAFVQDIPQAGVENLTPEDSSNDVAARLEPGIIEELPSGKTVTFANPPGVQNYKEYTSSILRGISVGAGITYEILSGDYSGVNYSSGRMGWIEFFRNVQTWREDLMMVQFLDEVIKDFKETASIMGVSFDGYTETYIAPKREMIDPTKEIPASIMAIKGGLSTLTGELMAMGKDPSDHFSQYKKDLDTLDKLKITVMSDARVPDGPGRPLGGSTGTGE